MKKRYSSFLILFIIPIFTGCLLDSFIPQTQNVPLFSKAKELKINSTMGFKNAENQIAYAPINHLGIMVNNQLGLNYSMTEFALGGFYVHKEKLFLELFGGYSSTSLKINGNNYWFFTTNNWKKFVVDIKANKYFLQPDIGLKVNNNFQFSLSSKFCYWKFPYYYNYTEVFEQQSGYYQQLKSTDSIDIKNGNQITIEPAITFKAGGKHLEFYGQLGGYILGSISKVFIQPYHTLPVFIKCGVTYTFDFDDWLNN